MGHLIDCSPDDRAVHGGSWTDPGGPEYFELLRKEGYASPSFRSRQRAGRGCGRHGERHQGVLVR